MTPLRVLIACETSGVMRRAFSALGHDTWSCDLLAAEDGSNRHVICDVRDLLGDGWDMLAVMHPPCTRLCRAGGHWLYGQGKSHPKKLPKGRSWQSMKDEFAEGVDLFRACWQAPIERVTIENPRMNSHAAEALSDIPPPHIVQPWWFGEPYFKATGFSLRNLPPLTPTNRLTPPPRGSEEWKRWNMIHRASPGPDRWKLRSRTFAGVAEAAAMQWGRWAEERMKA